MGRPQHLYQLSPQGRDRLRRNSSDSDSYGDFAVSLLDTLAETVGRDQMSSILRKQWERKAIEYRDHLGNGSLKERVAKLVELRKAEGFMAEWYPVDAEEILSMGDRNIIVGSHSPSFGFENNENECMEIVELIKRSQATVLAIGVGAPKQEKWIYKYKNKLLSIKFFFSNRRYY